MSSERSDAEETPREQVKTATELFADACQGEYDDAGGWAAVSELRLRNTAEIFQFASEHCDSANPRERARALDVLAQLGAGKPISERPWFDDSVSIAIRHLQDEDPLVVRSAAWALAHLADDRAVSALIRLQSHADAEVRWAVAFGVARREQPESARTLMTLMQDTDDEVRNWATFGLGTQCNGDSPEIRKALRERLDDPFPDARDEAVWGLARRRDRIGLQLLLERLEGDHGQGDEMAAAECLELDYDTPARELCRALRQALGQRRWIVAGATGEARSVWR
jgi:hypothetical protein